MLKAQASGPIELVVAVIILVASMGLAFIVLENTQTAQCTDKLKSQMRGLESVMIDVALGSPATSREVNIELSTCGGTNIEAIRVVHYDSQAYCGKCPSTGGGCWIIEPLSYSNEQRQYFPVLDAATCINIPGKVLLGMDDTCAENLISTPETGDAGCPPDKKESSEGCGLPPAVASESNRLLTMGKKPGETIYRAKITKEFYTSAGDPLLKVCFESKSGALR